MSVCLPTPTSLHPTQLRNKGEEGDLTYPEAVPWLEVATFGGVLATREVMMVAFVAYECAENLSAGAVEVKFILELN